MVPAASRRQPADEPIDAESLEAIRDILDDPDIRLSRLYWIITKGDTDDELVVRFVPNVVQQRLVDRLWHRNLVLKARQRGITTLIAILWLDTALFSPGPVYCGIIAHEREAAEEIFRTKVVFAYEHLPAWLKKEFPLEKKTATELVFAHNGATIRVATSMRSGTIHRLHVCLSGDTDILLKDGVTKPIKDIQPGDMVMTGRASYLPAVSLVKNRLSDVGEPMLALEVHGWHTPLKLTANHQILAREFRTGSPVWKEAGDLAPGDYIAFPVREISNKLRDKCLPFGPQQVRFVSGKRRNNEGRRIQVTRELGVLVGMYLAEGYIRRAETTFALHRGEEVEWFCALLEQFRDYFASYRVAHCKNSQTTCVVVNGRHFADFISDFFGDGVEKRIPDAVWTYGRQFADGLIFGYFKGDGCFTNVREVQVTSIRPQLIHQMRMLLVSTRTGVASVYHRPAGRYYGRDCKETWVLKLHGAANWKFRDYFGLALPEIGTRIGQIALGMPGKRNPIGRKNWRRGADHYWLRIKNIEIAQDEEFVYDIVLPDAPHSYVTVAGVVHNSELGKIAAKYPFKAREVLTGSIPAVPASGVLVVESTAEGQDGAFYDLAQIAKETADSGRTLSEKDYRFHFFSWWDADEYELDPDLVVITDQDHEYFRRVESIIGRPISMRKRAWYVATRRADFADEAPLMWQEYPSYPDEAFSVSMEGCYYATQIATARLQARILPSLPRVSAPVNTFWDIGKGDMTCIWFHQRVGPENRFIRYYEASGEDLDHYASYLQRTGFVFGTHYLPHEADHKRIGKDADHNQSIREMLEELLPGHKVEVVTRVTQLIAGIQATRRQFSTCLFDEQGCQQGIKRLAGYRKRWDRARGCWSDEAEHNDDSHGADAFRQFAQVADKGNTFVVAAAPNLSARRPASWRA